MGVFIINRGGGEGCVYVGITYALASLVFYVSGVPRCGVSVLVVDVLSGSQLCAVPVSVVAWPMCRLALDAAVVRSDRCVVRAET